LSVDGEIAAQGRNKLVLKAENNLLINAPVNVGSGGLAVYADSNGTGEGKVIVATDARIHASDGAPIDIYTNVPSYKDTTGYDGFITSPYRLWMLVNNVRQLQDTQTNLSGNYALGRDINAIETMSWNGGAGFMPIGSSFQGDFKGRFDGQNHVIYNLTINRPELSYVGLVGISEGDIRNLGLVDANVRGARVVGTFVGQNNGNLENVYATGNIQGGDAGGLVGINGQGFTSNGRISNAYSAVNVRGIDGLADLLNQKLGAGDDPYEIYAERMGGIASLNQGVIDSVYATGKVTLNSIYNKYSRAGGIVGYNYYGAKISNAYWATDGTGQSAIAGINNGTIDATSLANSLTNETLKTAALAFDFNNIWFRYDGYTAPLLRSFLKPLTISGVSRQIDKVYDGRAYAYQENFLYSSPEAASFAHLNSRSGATSGSQGEDVGTYTSGSATTFWSDQQGRLPFKPVPTPSRSIIQTHRHRRQAFPASRMSKISGS
jgi:hypothetical protein